MILKGTIFQPGAKPSFDRKIPKISSFVGSGFNSNFNSVSHVKSPSMLSLRSGLKEVTNITKVGLS